MNTAKQDIKVAIAGLGFAKTVHLPALLSNSDLKPIAAWHPEIEGKIDLLKEHQLLPYKDWSELINNSDIDAIILATPPGPRFELAKEALRAGKHLLLEKPVALEAWQAEELQKISIDKGLSVAVDFEYRAVPLFMQTKRLLSQKVIGEIWLAKLDWLMSSRADETRKWNWYSEKNEGGGVGGALGTHAFDILHWLVGPTNSVSSLVSTSIKKRPCPIAKRPREVTSEDISLAQLELTNFAQRSKVPAQVTLSSVSMNGRGFWLELYGSEGNLVLGSDNQKDYVHGFGLWLNRKGESPKRINADSDLTFGTTWTDGRIAPVARIQQWWAASIKTGKPVIPGLSEGIASQQVCEKLLQSAAVGKRLILGLT